jgi:hypothetical protein
MARNWQKIDARCHSCHSWQESYDSIITAMTLILIVALTFPLIILGLGVAEYAKKHIARMSLAGDVRRGSKWPTYDPLDPHDPHYTAHA